MAAFESVDDAYASRHAARLAEENVEAAAKEAAAKAAAKAAAVEGEAPPEARAAAAVAAVEIGDEPATGGEPRSCSRPSSAGSAPASEASCASEAAAAAAASPARRPRAPQAVAKPLDERQAEAIARASRPLLLRRRVRIHGLMGAAAYNGRHGRVMPVMDRSSGRYAVELEGEGRDGKPERIKVKETNLELAEEEGLQLV